MKSRLQRAEQAHEKAHTKVDQAQAELTVARNRALGEAVLEAARHAWDRGKDYAVGIEVPADQHAGLLVTMDNLQDYLEAQKITTARVSLDNRITAFGEVIAEPDRFHEEIVLPRPLPPLCEFMEAAMQFMWLREPSNY